MVADYTTFNGRASVALASLLLVGATLTVTAYAQLPPTQNAGGIQYVTGGFGQDESNAFKQAQSDYALALTFAASGADTASPAYAGDVQVQLRDAQGSTVLDVTSTGPYFLANPKPGTYKLAATYKGETQNKDVTIVAGKSQVMRFVWKRPAAGPD